MLPARGLPARVTTNITTLRGRQNVSKANIGEKPGSPKTTRES